MSILSRYYIDFGHLNRAYTTYDRVGDLGLVNKITDSSEWKKLDRGQKVLIFNTLRKLNILVPYDKMEQAASNSPNNFFYNNTDENVITEEDFEDEDTDEEIYDDDDDYDGEQ